MFSRHKHAWEKVYEATVPSFFERFDGIGGLQNMGNWMYERKHVVIMKCKCGKIKRILRGS